MNATTRWSVYAVLSECALQTNEWFAAEEGVDGLLTIDPDNVTALQTKIWLSWPLRKADIETIEALERLSQSTPKAMNTIELEALTEISLFLRLAGETALLKRMRHAVVAADYDPPDPLDSIEWLRLAHIRDLLEEGEVGAAADQMRLMSEPARVSEMIIDKRYDPLADSPGAPTLAMIADLVERQIQTTKSEVADYPDRLKARLNYIQALRFAGRFEEAVREGASAAADASGGDAAARFSDLEEYAPWILNERAYTLYDLGRNDEARTILLASSKLSESGSPNVSQTINYAEMLLSEGRLDDALSAISKLEASFASPYGRMWAAAVRVCARSFKNDLGSDDNDLAFIQENEKENDSAFAKTMLCIDEGEAYASQFKRRLADPEKRAAALQTVQEMIEPPASLPISRVLDERRQKIVARPDIRALIEENGRVLKLPFSSTYWSDY
jgi:tetratricopeptide (TPR) repeat protein